MKKKFFYNPTTSISPKHSMLRLSHLFYFVICLLTATAAYAQKKNNPLSYPYYIYGTAQINPENGTVMLKDISYKGFSCKEELWKTGVDSKEKAMFKFEEIKTQPYTPLAGKKLQYWRQDESGAWMTDEEGGNGIANAALEKDMTIMLVLDCSASLGEDFAKVKRGAISFIDKLYKASNKGFVRLGIIGFSSISEANRQTWDIRPLTSETYQNALSFINGLRPASNTALYYAISNATDMLDKYVKSNFSHLENDRYSGTYMLAFTDGIYNASQFRDKKIYTSKQAYEYTKNKILNTSIKDNTIETYIIGARGIDLKTSEQAAKFQAELKGLIPDGHLSDRFTYLENMQNLENTFENIADGLAKRWQNLYCYTSLAHEGGVCWTLGDPVASPVYVAPKPKIISRDLFLGLNVGAGFGMVDEFGGLYSIGVDFAYPIARKFGVGAYGTYKHMLPDTFGGAVGVMMTCGDYHSGRKAFVGGVGIEFNDWGDLMSNIRGGGMFRNGLYIMGEVAIGNGWRCSSYYCDYFFAWNMTIRIGYNFGRFIKVRKRR